MTYDIVVRDLHYAYPAGPPKEGVQSGPVLRGVSFQVARGEFVALLGRVGAGKTTLCMALNGLVPHATGGLFRGDVTVLDSNTKHHPVADLARFVGLVFQDPESQLTQMRVEDEVAFGPENLGVPTPEIAKRVAWALDVVGLSGYLDRSPLLLSGGEKQRVAIAAMLAMFPRVLVLDEPTASLDPAGKVAVFNALGDLGRERQITVFMATQEVERIPRFADRVLVLHDGRIALEGPPAVIFRNVAKLQEWGIGVPQLVELAHLLTQRTGHTYGFASLAEAYRQLRQGVFPKRARKAADQVSAARRPTKSGFARHFAKPRAVGAPSESLSRSAEPPADHPEITVEDVSYRYPDGTAALLDVNLKLSPGDFLALLGPNGSGKTTLAKHLNGLLRPTKGRVLVERYDTRATRVAHLARLVGYVFQNPDHQIFAPTVQEEVAFGPRIQGLPTRIVAQNVAEVLDRFHLAPYADVPPASLGFAQRRQVALAAVFAVQPGVLILDEPTGGLDARSQQELMEVITEFNMSGRTVVLITHDMPLVAEYASRAVVLLKGRVLFDGTVSTLFNQPRILADAGLALPPVKRLVSRLGLEDMMTDVLTPADFVATWQARPPKERRRRGAERERVATPSRAGQ